MHIQIFGDSVFEAILCKLVYLNFDYISKPLEKISLHILIFDDVLCVDNSVGTKFKFIDKL